MVKDVSVRFGGIRALNNVNLEFGHRGITAIIGPNGAGKSTLANVISGFQRNHSGSVTLGLEHLTGAHPSRISRAGVMRTFQRPRLLPGLSVLENVMIADRKLFFGVPWSNCLPRRKFRSSACAVGRAWAALEKFELTAIAQNSGLEISGGQQRLVELARMSLRAPRFLILDEPTAGVAPAMRRVMLGHLRTLRKTTGACLIIIEHDMSVVEALSEEVFVMAEGGLLTSGTMSEVRSDPRVLDAYLGVELPRRRGSGRQTAPNES